MCHTKCLLDKHNIIILSYKQIRTCPFQISFNLARRTISLQIFHAKQQWGNTNRGIDHLWWSLHDRPSMWKLCFRFTMAALWTVLCGLNNLSFENTEIGFRQVAVIMILVQQHCIIWNINLWIARPCFFTSNVWFTICGTREHFILTIFQCGIEICNTLFLKSCINKILYSYSETIIHYV